MTLVNFLAATTWRSRVYLNGGTTFTQWNTGAGGRVSRLLAIGDTSNGYNSWRGQLDDLRIYKRALTPAEITALYAPPAAPTSYDGWLAALPTPIPAGHHSPTADPDADGTPNLLEYALNADPMSAAAVPLVTSTSTLNLNSHLEVRYTRHRADLDYTVQSSSDLITWTDVSTNSGALGVEVTVQDPTPLSPAAQRRFLRLAVRER